MQISCIIVEDEPLAMERAKQYVAKTPFLDLVAVFENGMDAMAYLRMHTIDLVFLDINMGSFSGIQLLESTMINSQVILITAYHEYAIKAFDLKVADYLLKPYAFERFLQAVNRVQDNLQKREPSPPQPFIFIKTEHRLEKILLADILYIEGMRDYRKMHLAAKNIMTLKTFTELEQEIPPAIVCRIHKSYMVALGRIDSVENNQVRIGNELLPVSETYKKGFFDLIRHG